MKSTYRYIFAAMITVGCVAAKAQNLNSAYFVDDFKFRHSLNPAFGNEQSYFSIPALGNVNVSTQGNFGVKDVIMDNPLYGQPGQKQLTTFLNPNIYVGDALGGFSTGNNKLVEDLKLSILSFGFKGFGGYNTFEINVRQTLGVSLPYEFMEFAKNVGNNEYNIGDINIGAQAFAEVALGHSRQINDKLRVGAKLKFLVGAGRADVKIQNLTANLSAPDRWTLTGNGQANVSMKGFEFKSETKEYNDASRPSYRQVNDVDVDGAGIGGFGMAVDLGGVYKYNDDWTFSVALVDLGFINWKNNVQAVNNGEPFEFGGFNDMSVSHDNNGETIDDKFDDLGDQFTDFAHLKDEGDQGGRTTGIGATINLGAEYTLPVYKRVKFGILSSTRLQGKYSWTEGRVSANYSPLKWLNGGVNFAVSSFANSMGWVLNIHPKGLNLFVGMDRLLGKVSKQGIPLNSNTSVSVGMNITW